MHRISGVTALVVWDILSMSPAVFVPRTARAKVATAQNARDERDNWDDYEGREDSGFDFALTIGAVFVVDRSARNAPSVCVLYAQTTGRFASDTGTLRCTTRPRFRSERTIYESLRFIAVTHVGDVVNAVSRNRPDQKREKDPSECRGHGRTLDWVRDSKCA